MRTLYKINIEGTVQGVGFRPFVYHLAKELGLKGTVQNSFAGVHIEAEGDEKLLDLFLTRLEKEKPQISDIYNLKYSRHKPNDFKEFKILNSSAAGKINTTILPDIATCSECLQEMLDPGNRRYRYPFINCTHCGPRFSIIYNVPYDRKNTSMNSFQMCSSCQKEYNDPNSRRFHAQPNACPACGPQLELWDAAGNILASQDDALLQAAEIIREGKILALKGIGGFQLIVDAGNEDAVQELRKRKHRNEKPFAVMFPSLTSVKDDCTLSLLEEDLLFTSSSPIVILERKFNVNQSKVQSSPTLNGITLNIERQIAESVSPRNPHLGVLLPYSPLHHLLMKELNFPIVATSGNLSDEPICIDEYEASARLKDIADFFLVHNRPVVRHIDDSVVRVVGGREQVIRRARGYAPLPIHASELPRQSLSEEVESLIAVGGHLKNTIAISTGKEIYSSQHIGDLETEEAHRAFKKVIKDFTRLYRLHPKNIVCDLHPEYLSTKYANELIHEAERHGEARSHPSAIERDCFVPRNDIGDPIIKHHVSSIIPVQHHYAHVMSCMADNELSGNVLGVSWDGTGFGTDGTIWGSEFLFVTEDGYDRIAHFRNFPLPGGEASVKEPRRTALGVLYEIFGDYIFEQKDLRPMSCFTQNELVILQKMINNRLNTPTTCSAGRLFDAVASLTGLRQKVSFEGQAAMELEFNIDKSITDIYPFELQGTKPVIINWQPMIVKIINDVKNKINAGIIAAKFHNTLVEIIITIAQQINESRVVLSGGCFQNKYLTERTILRLREEGFQPYWHHRIPANDGGIAIGQIAAAQKKLKDTNEMITPNNDWRDSHPSRLALFDSK